MNATQLVLWTGLLATAFGPAPEPQEKQKEKKKSDNPISRFFDDEAERLAKEVDGTWTLFEYNDPTALLTSNVASGFATFHDGFLTLVLGMETVESGFLGLNRRLILDSGLFRYRIDEQANLQIANVLSFTNQTDDEELTREPSGRVEEYFLRLEDAVLELRDPDGVVLSFRKIAAGDFPESAIRKLDKLRGGTPQYEDEEDDDGR